MKFRKKNWNFLSRTNYCSFIMPSYTIKKPELFLILSYIFCSSNRQKVYTKNSWKLYFILFLQEETFVSNVFAINIVSLDYLLRHWMKLFFFLYKNITSLETRNFLNYLTPPFLLSLLHVLFPFYIFFAFAFNIELKNFIMKMHCNARWKRIKAV